VGGSGLEHAGHRLLPGEGSRVYGRVEDRARERRGVEGTGEGGRTATMNLCRDNREGEPPTAFSEPKAAAPPQVVRVIGGGLAGPDGALTAARLDCEVELYEMGTMVDGKPRLTPAHQTAEFGELVCSNSLKSESPNTAPWLLKQEMRRAGSALMRMADETAVPAGHALAGDRAEVLRRIGQGNAGG